MGEEGGETEKFEDLENKNNFSDDIRSIFSQFLKAFLSSQYTKRADITFKNLGLIFCTQLQSLKKFMKAHYVEIFYVLIGP